jgi:ParB family chromosome partitioning protein
MKLDKITSTIEQLPFADLYISDLNPRQMFDPNTIDALAENIRQLGLIQNLAGLRDEQGRVGIVAGGRRYRALAMLQDDPRFQTVPIKIAPDQATAEVWASSENHHREQPHPADEIREYGKMADRGVPVPSIAVAFGVTEKHVYRRLKLAALPTAVLDALKSGSISLSQAAAFTISEDEANSLTVLDKIAGSNYSDHQIKQLLKPDAVRQTDRRVCFVGQEAYQAEGGRITGDLFAEQVFFDDLGVLDDLFAKKLAQTAEGLVASGWKWAEALTSSYVGYHEIEDRKLERIYPFEGSLSEEQAERYDELAELSEGDVLDEDGEAELKALQAILDGAFTAEQKALAGILVYVTQNGELRTVEGLVTREDKSAAIEAGFLRVSAHKAQDDAAPKSALSQKLRDDLDRVAKGARQHAVLRDPELLIDLLAYQLSHNLYWAAPLGLSVTDVPTQPSTEAQGYQIDSRLTEGQPKDMYGRDLAKSFRAFRAKGAEHVRGELIRFLAAQYRGGDEKLAALIDKETQPRIRDVWTPTTANFFGRVSGTYLDALWCDLIDLAADHPTVTTFAKLKKAEKAAKLEALFSGDQDMRGALGLSEDQATRIDNWVPDNMA